VLERDTLPLDESHRIGTPQSRHVHALLGGGQRALCDLFPGFEDDLASAGAVPLRVGLDIRFETPDFDPFPVRDLGLVTYSMSRPLIELTVRRRVVQHANITIRGHYRVRDIVAASGGDAVSAIRFENAKRESETLAADLVVDASGHGNLTLGLLQAIAGRRPKRRSSGSTSAMPPRCSPSPRTPRPTGEAWPRSRKRLSTAVEA